MKLPNELFYIVFFFRKRQHVKKKRFRAFYEAQFYMFYYDLLVALGVSLSEYTHIFLERCDNY